MFLHFLKAFSSPFNLKTYLMKYHSSEDHHSDQFPDTSGSLSDKEMVNEFVLGWGAGGWKKHWNIVLWKKVFHTWLIFTLKTFEQMFSAFFLMFPSPSSPFLKWFSHVETRHGTFGGWKKGGILKTWLLLPWFPHQTMQRRRIFPSPPQAEKLWRCLPLPLPQTVMKKGKKESSCLGWEKGEYQLLQMW